MDIGGLSPDMDTPLQMTTEIEEQSELKAFGAETTEMKAETAEVVVGDEAPASENLTEVVEPEVIEAKEEPETPADSGDFIQETM